MEPLFLVTTMIVFVGFVAMLHFGRPIGERWRARCWIDLFEILEKDHEELFERIGGPKSMPGIVYANHTSYLEPAIAQTKQMMDELKACAAHDDKLRRAIESCEMDHRRFILIIRVALGLALIGLIAFGREGLR